MALDLNSEIPLELQRKIDAVCETFEDAWRRGQAPSLRNFLARGEAGFQNLLLLELLRVDREMRHRLGQPCDATTYQRELPDMAHLISGAFSALPVERPTSALDLQAGKAASVKSPERRNSLDDSNAICRSLLFGILALQMDFISREQLIAAMNAWTLDKRKVLPQVLRELGALADQHYFLLEPLVEAHIQQHNGDPEQSLAALDSMILQPEERSRLGNSELTASLDLVSTAWRASRMAKQVRPLTVADSITKSERFKVLRFHARGGLGHVSVALDQELHREVALKEIRPEYADNLAFRARFTQEAEINGGLEHPNIVPVYSLGAHSDGRPFYAMRFIKGDSLRQASERFHESDHNRRGPWEGSVEFRKLLGQLIDVCHAIAYAHSRKVLHRDLKPGNIMLGKYGETLVVDWGLAKVQGHRAEFGGETSEATFQPASGSAVEPTQVGARVGTLPYMSPEQARGEHDRLGPLSDVYSLGATLYHLLTGRAPFSANEDDLDLRAEKGDFSPPRAVNPRVPRALEAICLKAMAFSPERRYAAATDLADDIERWLSDEVVNAYRETRVERSARWIRRHRALALTVAASLASIAVLSLIAAATVSIFWRQTELARAREADAKAQARKFYLTARESVDRRSIQLRNLLKSAPDALPMGERLLDESLRDYEQFASYSTDDPDLELARGTCFVSIGDIHGSRGADVKAQEAFKQAEKHFQEFNTKFHGHLGQGQIELARAHNRHGAALAALGDYENAAAKWRLSIKLLAKPQIRFADSPEGSSVLATAHLSVAEERLKSGQPAAALEQLDAAGAVLPAVTEAGIPQGPMPSDRPLQLLLNTLRLRARINLALGKPADARQELERSLTVALLLAQRNDDDPVAAALPADVNVDLAIALRPLRQPYAELGAYQAALRIYDVLATKFPDWLTTRTNTEIDWLTPPKYSDLREGETNVNEALALTLTDRAQLFLELQRLSEAEADLAQAIPIFSELSAQHPNRPEYREAHAASLEGAGRLLHQQARFEEALIAYQSALRILNELVDQLPQITAYRQRLALTRSLKAQALAAQGELARADADFQQSLSEMEELRAQSPDMPILVNHLAHLHERWGAALWHLGRPERSEAEYTKALGIWREIVARWPQSESKLAYADLLANCPVSRLRIPNQALEIAQQVLDPAVPDPVARAVLASALFRDGNWRQSAALLDEGARDDSLLARECFLRALLYVAPNESAVAREPREEPAVKQQIAAQQLWDLGNVLRRNRPGDQDLERLAHETAAALNLRISN